MPDSRNPNADVQAAVAGLLSPETAEPAEEVLRHFGLLGPEGFDALLDEARRRLDHNPSEADAIAKTCGQLAVAAGAPAVEPAAHYLRGQIAAMRGNLGTARELVTSSLAGYAALGLDREAMRTNLGLMHVLNELGLHRDAIDLAQTMLTSLETLGSTVDPASTLLRGSVQLNLGACYDMLGEFAAALEAYAEAEEAFLSAGRFDRVAWVAIDRGVALLNLGRAGGAVLAFEAAAAHAAAVDDQLLHAMTLTNLGNAHVLLGDYTTALRELEEAEAIFAAVDPDQAGILRIDLGNVHLAMNLFPEAALRYREALATLPDTGAHHRARAQWGLGASLLSQGDVALASEALAAAADSFSLAGNRPLHCAVLLELAAAASQTGDPVHARRIAEEALALVADGPAAIERVQARLRLADLAFPDVEQAAPPLLAAQRDAEDLEVPHVRYRLNQRLGRLRRLEGRHAEARVHLEAAVEQIETLRSGLLHEALRTSFLHDKSSAYEELVHLHLDSGTRAGYRRAFAVAEQAKSRSLVELLLTEVGARLATAEDEDPALREMQADLDAIYNQWLGVDSRDSQRGAATLELESRAFALERALAQMTSRRTAPRRPRPITAVDLPEGTRLVEYFVADGELIAFVHDGNDMEVVRNVADLGALDWSLRQLYVQFDRFLTGGEFVAKHQSALHAACLRVLCDLYRHVYAPVADRLGGGDSTGSGRIIVVPHGPLHHIPFHALHGNGRHIVEDHEVSYAPSATVLSMCLERPRRLPRRALVVGVTDASIPAAEAEARAVAARFAAPTLLVGAEATRAAVLAGAGFDVLHLASHGLFREDNPLFSALRLTDGWVTARELADVDLHDCLVTVSACESGQSRIGGGDESIGLTRSLLQAGAQSVMASMWLVQDDTTPALMDTYYSALTAGARPATALRSAQLAALDAHPHPYYWAPFFLVGKP